MARGNRADTTRSAAARRISNEDAEALTLYIPPNAIPKGMIYAWIAEYLMGDPQDNNVEKRLRKGWNPVPADRHPDLVAPLLPGRVRNDHNVIRRGGQILCEMSKPEHDEYLAAKRRQNLADMQSTQWTRGDLQDDDKRMPMVELGDDVGMNQTSIERVVALPDK